MKLQDYLAETGLTQGAFAKLIGATQEQVSRYASGTRKPREEPMREIFRVTKGRVDANDFYGLPESVDDLPPPRQTSEGDTSFSKDAAE